MIQALALGGIVVVLCIWLWLIGSPA